MNNILFYDCLLTPNSKKVSTKVPEMSYYSPSPLKSSSLQSTPYTSASQSPNDQIESLRLLRQTAMNPQGRDEKFLKNQEEEMMDFIKELESMELSLD